MKKTALLTMALVASLSLNAAAETIRLNGSSTVVKAVMAKIQEPFKKATGIDLVITGNGSGNGAKDLLDGRCDAAMASESIADLAKKLPALSAPDIRTFVVAEDEIKVFVNRANPVSRLSREQIKGLHTGRIKNWKEVGGPDMEVIVVTSHKNSGNRSAFSSIAMDGEPYTADAIEEATDIAEIKEVATIKESISAIGTAFLDDSVKVVEAPRMARQLILISRGEPGPSVQKLLAFINNEGSRYIK
jgi:phosphate transport system substrate-binding protein